MNKQHPTSLDASKRVKSIRPTVLAYIALRNLWSKRLRTILTISGVVIGIGAIVFLISLGLGLQSVVSDQVVNSSDIKTVDVTTADSKSLRLTGDSIAKIRALGTVEQVAKSYASGGSVTLDGAQTDSVIYAADDAYLNLSSLRLAAGTSIKLDQPNQVLVNQSLLKAIGITKAADAVGKNLKIHVSSIEQTATDNRKPLDITVTVLGVVDTGSGAEIYMRDDVFSNAGANQYAQLKVVANRQQDVNGIRKFIDGLGYTTASPIDTLDQVNQIFNFFTFILAGFGGIGMTIAVLGMFNTLTISLLERTREIGLMVSLGARARDIKRLFVIEALTLSFGGGLLGLLVAVGIGHLIDLILSRIATSRGVTESISIFSTPWWLWVGVLTFVGIVGMIVVFYPARRASRISPIDALRRE